MEDEKNTLDNAQPEPNVSAQTPAEQPTFEVPQSAASEQKIPKPANLYTPQVAPAAAEPEKQPIYKKWWFWLLIGLAVVIIFGCAIASCSAIVGLSNAVDSAVESSSVTDAEREFAGEVADLHQKNEDESSTDVTDPSVEEETQSESEPIPEAESEPESDPDVPLEYLNALAKAQQYSDVMYMSKKGIRRQLTSEYGEDFSEKAADYALKHVDADWKKNATEKAKSYAETMHMSESAIRKQLTSEYGEQFTESEADYAIKHYQD